MKREEGAAGTGNIPLILDVDGSLLPTDLLLETFWAALGKNLLAALAVIATSFWSPARMKHRLSRIATPEIQHLPIRQAVLDVARRAALDGRTVILSSGAEQSLVDGLARRLGFAGAHFGSDGARNLTGAQKATLLVERFGEGGFDYVGDSAPDLAVWRHARKVIAVAPGRLLTRRIAALGKPAQIIGNGWTYSSLLKEMRPYQWVKNLLLLIPLLVEHSISVDRLLPVLAAITAFCVGSSALYLVNDMLDLAADRKHAEKRYRPIASGALPIRIAMLASLTLGAAGLTLSWMVGADVAGLLLVYMAGSLVYSLRLKRLAWVDLLVLASLYTLRVVAGAAAASVSASLWALPFCFAVFFCLTAVKRLTDLARFDGDGPLPGRRYERRHVTALLVVADLAAMVAIGFYLPYTFTPEAASLYSNLFALRLAAIPIALWLLRMVRLSQIGREDYDPIVFISHDATGFLIVAAGLSCVLFAI